MTTPVHRPSWFARLWAWWCPMPGQSLESVLRKAERDEPALVCQARRELRDMVGTRLSKETQARLLRLHIETTSNSRSALR